MLDWLSVGLSSGKAALSLCFAAQDSQGSCRSGTGACEDECSQHSWEAVVAADSAAGTRALPLHTQTFIANATTMDVKEAKNLFLVVNIKRPFDPIPVRWRVKAKLSEIP
jgi:hypothetical protein